MKTSSSGRIGVIGGGLGGLAAACTLAARGYKVVLFERNEWLGGKAAKLEEAGFRFDMGPTIVTIPSVLRRIFAEANRKMEDYLDMVRLDPQWRCFFQDGSVLNLMQNPEQMTGELWPATGQPEQSESPHSLTDFGDERFGRFGKCPEEAH